MRMILSDFAEFCFMKLQRKVLEYIRANSLLQPGDRLLVALSGGADSVAMLDLLVNLHGMRLQLVVAHMNHLLRGADSDADEYFAAEAAKTYRLPFCSARVDVAAVAKERGLSIEEAGREERYRFLRQSASEYGCRRIALGHHLDDQAETFLIRLMRGSGSSGLASMRPYSESGLLIRPLLGVRKTELEDYLRCKNISWREDVSNHDTSFLRNRVRHQLLPLLADYNPEATVAIARAAELLAGDDELLESMTRSAFERLFSIEANTATAVIGRLLAQPRAIRLRLLREGVKAVKGDLRRISSGHIADIEKLLASSNPSAGLDLPCAVRVSRVYEKIRFTSCHDAGSDHCPDLAAFERNIYGEGVYQLPSGGELQVDIIQCGGQRNSADRLFLDPSILSRRLELRYFRNGDRFVPSGMTGTKKLKDFFIDRKLPLELRRKTPILLCDGELVWVCGIQAASIPHLLPAEGDTAVRLTYTRH